MSRLLGCKMYQVPLIQRTSFWMSVALWSVLQVYVSSGCLYMGSYKHVRRSTKLTQLSYFRRGSNSSQVYYGSLLLAQLFWVCGEHRTHGSLALQLECVTHRTELLRQVRVLYFAGVKFAMAASALTYSWHLLQLVDEAGNFLFLFSFLCHVAQ